MEIPIIFYYICRGSTSIDFSHWHDQRITLKIVVDSLPEEVVNKQTPNIHWMTATEFEGHKTTNQDKMIFIELPSLFHVPSFGKDFFRNISEGCGIMVPVFDFDWVYYIKSDNFLQNIVRISQHDILIENKMTDRETWITNHIQPSWDTFNKHKDELDIFHKRIFLGLSKVLNEWRVVGELSTQCEWPQAIVEYDKAEVDFYTQLRLPLIERQQYFFQELTKNQYCFETWWSLLEHVDKGGDVSVVRGRLMMKTLLNEQNPDGSPEWCQDIPLGRWVQKKITDDDALYQREIGILKNLITEEFAPLWGKHLFSRVLRLKNPSSHHKFTQESINFLTKIKNLDGCERGDLLFSREDTDFVPSSSGLMVYPDNPRWYIVNVRKVNYRILTNGAYVTVKNGSINPTYNGISKNEFYFMDRETLKPVSPVRPMNEDIPGLRKDEIAIVGLEDVRLVPGINQDVLFYGVTKSYSYSGAIRIITGKYDIERALFHDTKVIHPPYEENSCEKNWTWCGENRYIYKWNPVEIGSVDANTRLVIDERLPSPSYFREFRGSSPAVIWRGYHFFSVHSVMMGENGRKYVHSIVVMDLLSKEHKLIGTCSPFCFEDVQIEYNIGLDIYKGKMLFLYSTRDSTSKYARIPLSYILEKMVFYRKQSELDFKTKIYQDVF
jgi:hypothetical protein